MTVDISKMLFEQVGKLKMTFKEDGSYIETQPSGKEKTGTYTFQAETSLLTVNINKPQSIIVKKINGQLCLESEFKEGKKMQVFVEKE